MPARTFHVKNFERFQHYRDRDPPWIKFYNSTLDDYEFACLPDHLKWQLCAIWLLASRSKNKIPYDAEWLRGRLCATTPIDLNALLKSGFIELDQDCSDTIAEPEQHASKPLALARSREAETEGETETDPPPTPPKNRGGSDTAEFMTFWEAYPHKVGKPAARTKFAIALRKANLETILAGLERYKRAKPPDREWCHPTTWLSQERWNDQPAPLNGATGKPNGHAQPKRWTPPAVGSAEWIRDQKRMGLLNDGE